MYVLHIVDSTRNRGLGLSPHNSVFCTMTRDAAASATIQVSAASEASTTWLSVLLVPDYIAWIRMDRDTRSEMRYASRAGVLGGCWVSSSIVVPLWRSTA